MDNDAAEPTEPSAEAENQQPPVLQSPEVKADNTMGMLCHLLALTPLLGIPFGNILGPLIVWLVKRDDDPFVDLCGKESINFQISVIIYGGALFLLMVPAVIIPFIGVLLVPLMMLAGIALAVTVIVYTIIAAIKASEGTSYTYPFTIRFIK
jgi:uncharacterized Tic20 family protein